MTHSLFNVAPSNLQYPYARNKEWHIKHINNLRIGMDWNKVTNSFKDIFKPDKKEWLEQLIVSLERLKEEDKNLPFRIAEIKERGFVTKIHGLYAFISFYHMPWQYSDLSFWEVVFPHLLNKTFFCKIYKFERNDQLRIVLNGQVAQFKPADLIEGEEYRGLILKKSRYGLFIDIGLHFNWQCGSLFGLLHKMQIRRGDSLDNYLPGDEITVEYQKQDDVGHLHFGNDVERIDWFLQKPQELVGQIVWARVNKAPEENEISLSVKGKYKANLTISKENYNPKYIKRIKTAKNNLYDGKIIHCEVTDFDRRKKTLQVKWLTEVDTDIIPDNPLMNCIDNETFQKLSKMKNETDN